MSLLTMGYRHLTVITMGLGNSIRIIKGHRARQYGVVEFEGTTPRVAMTDKPIHERFEDTEKESVKINREVIDVSADDEEKEVII